MEVLLILMLILLFSFLVETLVEFMFATVAHWIVGIVPKAEPLLFPQGDKPSHIRIGIIQSAAVAVGIAGALVYQFDILSLLAEFLSKTTGAAILLKSTTLSIVITGIAIGKGSNYLHDLIGKFFKKPESPT